MTFSASSFASICSSIFVENMAALGGEHFSEMRWPFWRPFRDLSEDRLFHAFRPPVGSLLAPFGLQVMLLGLTSAPFWFHLACFWHPLARPGRHFHTFVTPWRHFWLSYVMSMKTKKTYVVA